MYVGEKTSNSDTQAIYYSLKELIEISGISAIQIFPIKIWFHEEAPLYDNALYSRARN